MTKLKFLPVVNIALILGCILYYVLSQMQTNSEQKMVYVDTAKLFNEFFMTKDIKINQNNILKNASKIQDSLVTIYNALPNKNDEQANRLRSLLTLENQKLQELQQNLYQEMNVQVWNRLNGYIKEYNNDNHLDIIFGSNGNGTIMHAKDALNKTDAILIYVNNRYEGAVKKN